MPRPFLVQVVGDGPAALATAIGLRLGGAAVRITPPRGAHAVGHAPADAVRLADSLSPAGHALLARLGVAADFAADAHLPCHAHASDWGPGGLRHFDFVSHPQGIAWHVDRHRFDARLRARALALGAVIGEAGADAHADPDTTADATVDATGRSSHYARRRGCSRLRGDRQIAWLASVPTPRGPGDSMSLVEATPDGWWYSAPAPGGRWSLACFTDADLRPRGRGPAGWLQRLQAAPRTLDRLIDRGIDPLQLLARPGRVVPADSSRLDRLAGGDWLAVGDAAMSYDPVSAHGLTVALQSGLHAAEALLALRDGDRHALPAYARRLENAFDAYQAERLLRYQGETRHGRHTYWQRRRGGRYDAGSSSLASHTAVAR